MSAEEVPTCQCVFFSPVDCLYHWRSLPRLDSCGCKILLPQSFSFATSNTDLRLKTCTLQRQLHFHSCQNGRCMFAPTESTLQRLNGLSSFASAKTCSKFAAATTTRGLQISSLLFCSCEYLLMQEREADSFVAANIIMPLQNCLQFLQKPK